MLLEIFTPFYLPRQRRITKLAETNAFRLVHKTLRRRHCCRKQEEETEATIDCSSNSLFLDSIRVLVAEDAFTTKLNKVGYYCTKIQNAISTMLGLFYNRSNATKTRRTTSFSITAISLLFFAAGLLGPQSQVGVNSFMPQPLHPRLFRQSSSSSRMTEGDEGVLDRFISPKIDDPALPLTEAGIAQVVAPTLQLFWLKSLNAPFPSWATPLYDYTFSPRGAVLAPTLIHGAGLACCWLLGCLAVKGYEEEIFEAELPQVLLSTVKAGAFACGILIFSTQIELYQEMGGYVQLGDSPETDMRIYRAFVEIITDIFFEATTLLTWRAFRSKVNQW